MQNCVMLWKHQNTTCSHVRTGSTKEAITSPARGVIARSGDGFGGGRRRFAARSALARGEGAGGVEMFVHEANHLLEFGGLLL